MTSDQKQDVLRAALLNVDPRDAVVAMYALLRTVKVPASRLDEVGRDRCRDAMRLGQALTAEQAEGRTWDEIMAGAA